MTRADVIVLNYNGRRFLTPCLNALRAQSFHDFRVIVVDNASTDGSVETVKTEFPEVHTLVLSSNQGFCGGNNRGIEATTSEYVALINMDTEVTPGWLQALVEVLDRQPDIGFCASRIVRISDCMTLDTAGDVFYTHGVGGKRGEGQCIACYANPEQVFSACAAAAIYRRCMLEDIGLFDEDFFARNEDLDLGFRAQLRGYSCQYVPEAVAYHHVGGSFVGQSATWDPIERRNMLDVLIKNLPAALWFKYALLIFVYYLLGDIYYVFRHGPQTVLGARSENMRRLRRTLSKRRQIQGHRVISVSALDAKLTHQGLKSVALGMRRRLG